MQYSTIDFLGIPEPDTRDDVRAAALSEGRLGLVRAPLSLACMLGLISMFDLATALLWGGATLGVEIVNRVASVRAAKGARGWPVVFLLTSMAVSLAWTSYGVMLWVSHIPEAQLAAMATFLSVPLYTIAFSFHSQRLMAGVIGIPIVAMAGCVVGHMVSNPPSASAAMLAIVIVCVSLIIAASALISHAHYARMWEAREKLAEQFDALEEKIEERTREYVAATARAEEANVAKSHFLANMSHELRTPLNAVIGYAEMLEEDLEAEGLGAQKKDAVRIGNSGRHLLKLVNDVLDISKIEANRLELDCEFNDAGRMLRDIQDSLRPAAAEKGNCIDVRVAADVGAIWADGLRLHQCVLNLASNANKFTTNGVVSLTVERADDESGAWVAIRVRDTGIGIAPENIDKLFQPFVQADVTTTRRFGGTGLGLSITRKLARLMGGGVEVESVEAAGSTFTLKLPYRTAREDGATESEARVQAA